MNDNDLRSRLWQSSRHIEVTSPDPGTFTAFLNRQRRRWRLAEAAGATLIVAAVIGLTLTLQPSGSTSVHVLPAGTGPSTTITAPATLPAVTVPHTIVSVSARPTLVPTTATVGAACTHGAISRAILLQDPGATIDRFGCAGDFAYAFISVPAPSSAAKGTPGVGETVLLKASGSLWEPANRSTYCPDHAVPAAVYQNACETN